jgi:hypothetical protein
MAGGHGRAMGRNKAAKSAPARGAGEILRAAGRRGRRAARTLARGTLLAAGIAATQISPRDTDPKFHLFNPAVVDRLHEPISRCRQ